MPKEEEKIQKEYLGDRVYVEFAGEQIILTTEDGERILNTIYLELKVYAALTKFVEGLKH